MDMFRAAVKAKLAAQDKPSKSDTAVGVDTAPKKSVDEIAREVICGAWGNGADRKNRLTAAGYDYSAVQSRVNALLK